MPNGSEDAEQLTSKLLHLADGGETIPADLTAKALSHQPETIEGLEAREESVGVLHLRLVGVPGNSLAVNLLVTRGVFVTGFMLLLAVEPNLWRWEAIDTIGAGVGLTLILAALALAAAAAIRRIAWEEMEVQNGEVSWKAHSLAGTLRRTVSGLRLTLTHKTESEWSSAPVSLLVISAGSGSSIQFARNRSAVDHLWLMRRIAVVLGPDCLPDALARSLALHPSFERQRRAEGAADSSKAGLSAKRWQRTGALLVAAVAIGSVCLVGTRILWASRVRPGAEVPPTKSARNEPLRLTDPVGRLCREYAEAQIIYRTQDWGKKGRKGYAHPHGLLNTTPDDNGVPLQFIDSAFANAGSPDHPIQGYYFRDCQTIGGVAIDWDRDFALCALPVTYGQTGRMVYVVKTDGIVWGKDLGKSEFVADFPADPAKSGWQHVE